MTTNTTLPPIGSVWKEDDARSTRYVQVVGYQGDKVRIVTCEPNGKNIGKRMTYANVKRFGKSGGYKLRWSSQAAA